MGKKKDIDFENLLEKDPLDGPTPISFDDLLEEKTPKKKPPFEIIYRNKIFHKLFDKKRSISPTNIIFTLLYLEENVEYDIADLEVSHRYPHLLEEIKFLLREILAFQVDGSLPGPMEFLSDKDKYFLKYYKDWCPEFSLKGELITITNSPLRHDNDYSINFLLYLHNLHGGDRIEGNIDDLPQRFKNHPRFQSIFDEGYLQKKRVHQYEITEKGFTFLVDLLRTLRDYIRETISLEEAITKYYRYYTSSAYPYINSDEEQVFSFEKSKSHISDFNPEKPLTSKKHLKEFKDHYYRLYDLADLLFEICNSTAGYVRKILMQSPERKQYWIVNKAVDTITKNFLSARQNAIVGKVLKKCVRQKAILGGKWLYNLFFEIWLSKMVYYLKSLGAQSDLESFQLKIRHNISSPYQGFYEFQKENYGLDISFEELLKKEFSGFWDWISSVQYKVSEIQDKSLDELYSSDWSAEKYTEDKWKNLPIVFNDIYSFLKDINYEVRTLFTEVLAQLAESFEQYFIEDVKNVEGSYMASKHAEIEDFIHYIQHIITVVLENESYTYNVTNYNLYYLFRYQLLNSKNSNVSGHHLFRHSFLNWLESFRLALESVSARKIGIPITNKLKIEFFEKVKEKWLIILGWKEGEKGTGSSKYYDSDAITPSEYDIANDDYQSFIAFIGKIQDLSILMTKEGESNFEIDFYAIEKAPRHIQELFNNITQYHSVIPTFFKFQLHSADEKLYKITLAIIGKGFDAWTYEYVPEHLTWLAQLHQMEMTEEGIKEKVLELWEQYFILQQKGTLNKDDVGRIPPYLKALMEEQKITSFDLEKIAFEQFPAFIESFMEKWEEFKEQLEATPLVEWSDISFGLGNFDTTDNVLNKMSGNKGIEEMIGAIKAGARKNNNQERMVLFGNACARRKVIPEKEYRDWEKYSYERHFSTHDWLAYIPLKIITQSEFLYGKWSQIEDNFWNESRIKLYLYATAGPDHWDVISYKNHTPINNKGTHYIRLDKDGTIIPYNYKAESIRRIKKFPLINDALKISEIYFEKALDFFKEDPPDYESGIFYLGMITHYISDCASFPHVIEFLTDRDFEGNIKNFNYRKAERIYLQIHKEYEDLVSEKTCNYEDLYEFFQIDETYVESFLTKNFSQFSLKDLIVNTAYNTLYDSNNFSKFGIYTASYLLVNFKDNKTLSKKPYADRIQQNLLTAIINNGLMLQSFLITFLGNK